MLKIHHLLILAALFAMMSYSAATVSSQTCRTDIPASTPTNRFVVNANGTVNDTATGLIWKRCAEGQSGTNCTGMPNSFTWQQALQHAEQTSFAGFDDWRLPNYKELYSLIEVRCFEPAINLTIFPNASSSLFWSASSSTSIRTWNYRESFVLDFSSGQILSRERDNSIPGVWLVRGGS